jgi:uncharacterized SAM-binding protein YcdF (DUF218 family)
MRHAIHLDASKRRGEPLLFLLKKFVGRLLLPLPLCCALLVLGLVFLWWTKRQKTGKVLVTLATLLLGLLGTGSTAGLLLGPLESEYPVLHDAERLRQDPSRPIRWIVVLSGGFAADEHIPLSARPTPATLTRLVEGIRLHRQLKGSKLALSLEQDMPEDDLVQLLAILGIDRAAFVLARGGRDTQHEAELFREIIGRDEAVLVTSAAHMARAVALFRARGMNPLAAPTEHLVKSEPAYMRWIPSTKALKSSETLFYECLGSTWRWLASK